jgi:environmental stress-induced protein Ves
MKIIRQADFQMMPWKNGLGETAEIALFPTQEDFLQLQFHWRLSSARVKSSNRFSVFPGYDRWLIVTEGDGLRLNGDSLARGQPFFFHGEDLVDCELLADSIVDYGLIFRRDLVQAKMQVLRDLSSCEIFQATSLCFLRSASGPIFCCGQEMMPSDVLQLDSGESVQIQSRMAPLELIQVSIDCI